MNMAKYNVVYEVAGKVQLYCATNLSTHEEAETQLQNFRRLYMKGDKGKRQPGGRGVYPFRNPRIVKLEEEEEGSMH